MQRTSQARRDAFADHLGEVGVTAATAGRESLSDYTNLTEVAHGRFSVVFYAENKVRGHRQSRSCRAWYLVLLEGARARSNGASG